VNPVCPYCRTEVGAGEGERLDCPGCGTPHHPECFAENGGCTVFGCSKAPQDEPKISVSGTEANRGPAPIQPALVPRMAHSGGFSILQLSGPAAPAGAQNAGGQGARAVPPPPPPPASGTGAAPPPMPSTRGVYAPLQLLPLPAGARSKSRQVYVLLGVFLGIFGVHNFYAGYIQRAVSQLCLTVLTCFYGAIVSWVWAIVEICIVSKDYDGVEFT
jgi:TM2 domain-containing membrane protein YozV